MMLKMAKLIMFVPIINDSLQACCQSCQHNSLSKFILNGTEFPMFLVPNLGLKDRIIAPSNFLSKEKKELSENFRMQRVCASSNATRARVCVCVCVSVRERKRDR